MPDRFIESSLAVGETDAQPADRSGSDEAAEVSPLEDEAQPKTQPEEKGTHGEEQNPAELLIPFRRRIGTDESLAGLGSS